MIDHVGIAVSNALESRKFYDAVLAPIGVSLLMEIPANMTESGGVAFGYGRDDKPFFWFGDEEKVGEGFHVAFAVDSRQIVDAFYSAAIEAGGRDNGAPGLRPHYHANYYAAFVWDPDGHNIEVVCHRES